LNDLKYCKVLVTPTSFGKGDPGLVSALESAVGRVVYNPFRRPLTSAELAELLPGCDGYIAGLDVIDRAALQAADRLLVVARYGVGVDNVDLAAAAEKGIIVTNTPGANSGSVAELAVSLILALARNLVEAAVAARAGGWPRLQGASLESRCVGLLGFGAVGKQVGRRLGGFGCRVLAYDPYPDPTAATEMGVALVTFDEVLAQSDFLSLHLPVLPETRRLVDSGFLRRMKDGACLVNTARGELIDEAALVEALQSGKLRGAALDVFPVEPPAADNPLLQLPQVLVTPHISSHTDIATRNMGRMALAECLAVLRGETLRYRVK
jgi:D-3-phosphoglycerate dehydrogenase / 2-oxoglutarate reductase